MEREARKWCGARIVMFLCVGSSNGELKTYKCTHVVCWKVTQLKLILWLFKLKIPSVFFIWKLQKVKFESNSAKKNCI